MTFLRSDGRERHELRSLSYQLDFQKAPDGSVLLFWGDTHILCSVTIDDRVPPHRLESGGGWLTAEYNMLPGSGQGRIGRSRGKVRGRTAEIQRLIGRSLRSVVDLNALPSITLTIDCDVINADGGTRCASISAAYIAVVMAMERYNHRHDVAMRIPEPVAAVSVGIVDGEVLTDLCYVEDASAHVDMNIVSSKHGIVEVQGTGESAPFSRQQLDDLVSAGIGACEQLHRFQLDALEAWRNKTPSS